MSLLNRVFYRNRKICKSHVAEGVDQFYSSLTHVIRNRFSFIYLFFICLFIYLFIFIIRNMARQLIFVQYRENHIIVKKGVENMKNAGLFL